MTDKVQNDTIDHIGLSTNNILLEQLSRNDGIISFQVTAERNLWYDHRTLPTCNKICNANKPIPVFVFTEEPTKRHWFKDAHWLAVCSSPGCCQMSLSVSDPD